MFWQFFFPQGVWGEKVYTAELTITQAVADASNGGVIYYFCHIHSKMSGKLIIQQADGTPYTNGLPELELYPPVYQDDVDKTCGTSGVSEYRFGGPKDCEKSFLCGALGDGNFGQCLQAVDCAMAQGMYSETTPNHHDPIVTFMEQMIPHHLNAINMAKLLLKQEGAALKLGAAVADSDDAALYGLLWDIINVQNHQVHYFRNYLGAQRGGATKHVEKKGAMCRSGDSCQAGYHCKCSNSRRHLLFASTGARNCACVEMETRRK